MRSEEGASQLALQEGLSNSECAQAYLIGYVDCEELLLYSITVYALSLTNMYTSLQSAGSALARVLTGSYNPAGRLPNTWPASLDQVYQNFS